MECKQCGKTMENTEKGDYTGIADVWTCKCGYVYSSCYECEVDGVGVGATELCEYHRNNVSVVTVNFQKIEKKCEDCLVGLHHDKLVTNDWKLMNACSEPIDYQTKFLFCPICGHRIGE